MRKVTLSDKPNQKSNVGERIKYIRTSKNMTQEDLGIKVNRTRQEINYYENNTRKVDLETLVSIANVLEVSLDYLNGITDIEKPNLQLQAINEKLGLSEKAIFQIMKFKNSKEVLSDVYDDFEIAGVESEEKKLAMLNMLLENSKFDKILEYMVSYEKTENEIENFPSVQAFQRNNKEMLEDKKSLIEYKIMKTITEILNEK